MVSWTLVTSGVRSYDMLLIADQIEGTKPACLAEQFDIECNMFVCIFVCLVYMCLFIGACVYYIQLFIQGQPVDHVRDKFFTRYFAK